MTKTDLITALADRTDMPKTQVQSLVDALFDTDTGVIVQALRKNDDVNITGFGKFMAKERKARMGRNPQTGATMQIGPSTAATFSAGKGLKDALNG